MLPIMLERQLNRLVAGYSTQRIEVGSWHFLTSCMKSKLAQSLTPNCGPGFRVKRQYNNRLQDQARYAYAASRVCNCG